MGAMHFAQLKLFTIFYYHLTMSFVIQISAYVILNQKIYLMLRMY